MIKKFEEFNFFKKKEDNGFISDWRSKIVPMDTKEYVHNQPVYMGNIFNMIINERSKKYDDILGGYFMSILNGKSKAKKISDYRPEFIKHLNEKPHSALIFFITTFVDGNFLDFLLGNKYLHNEFGEGDEERLTSDPLSSGQDAGIYSYASYYFTINGMRFHAGYDQRGTAIEVEWENHTINIEELCENIKTLMSAYVDYL